ncbi:MAG TPA: NADH-quinone oxidoreductase subunit NuoH [Terriglobales bacterium]|nr:NADH-quinone oxidoreductase subunit NuoH [Terriglobales bacterium]
MDWKTYIALSLGKTVIFFVILLTAVAYTVLLERKLVARIQNRWGPTRVGPFGLLQPLADGLKFIFKEDLIPANVYKPLYVLAPMLSLTVALMAIAVIPVGERVRLPRLGIETPLQITDVNIGLLFLLGVTSVGVYGVALAGWSSNSKYSLLGSLRASAQMISYELSLGLSLVGVLILSGTLSLREIVDAQAGTWFGFLPRWNIFPQALGFFIYLTAAFAETNRIPFDLPESETELVAGYHTEYSAMKFAMFFMAEYINMFTVSCVATLLFFGGWHGPVFGPPALQAVLPLLWFVVKVFFFIFLYIWIRGTLPRFRYDQLMAFGWKVLLPLALFNVMATGLIVAWRG